MKWQVVAPLCTEIKDFETVTECAKEKEQALVVVEGKFEAFN